MRSTRARDGCLIQVPPADGLEVLAQELATEYPGRFSTRGGLPALCVQGAVERGYRLRLDDRSLRIEYATRADLARALGSLLADASSRDESRVPAFSFRGLMLDVSRNGVIRMDRLRQTLLRLALLGYSHLCLYTEDTYEVAGHPLIGYRRGGYTKAELRSFDAYAAELGITMFPCIQTLGHLEQILKHGRYRGLGENESVLSVAHPEVRPLVETLVREASEPYASELIHVGMDETRGIGRGSGFVRGQPIDPRALYLDHVRYVAELCARLGLRPMMWGDVIVGKDEEAMSEAQRAAFPEAMDVVFWDYYAEDSGQYARRIAEYRRMGKEPLCAPGAWNWGCLWPSFRKVRQTLPLFMEEARQAGIQKVLLTTWGDDGQECPLAAVWPAFALFAEEAWNPAGSAGDGCARITRALTGLDAPVLERLGDLDLLPGSEGKCGSLGKLLLWEDPLCGRYSHQLGEDRLARRFAELASIAAEAGRAAPQSERRLLVYAEALCRVLAVKADLFNETREAYRAGDRAALRRLSLRIRRLIPELRRLWRARKELWFTEFKSAGWEILDQRFGGLMTRLETMSERLEAFRSGKLASIEELEAEPLDEFENLAIAHPRYRDLHTGSVVQ